jgi:thiol-disulfide isomerase/thioredoxin
MKTYLTIILCILIFNSLGQDHKISIGPDYKISIGQDYKISPLTNDTLVYTDTNNLPAKTPAAVCRYYDENYKIIDSVDYFKKFASGDYRSRFTYKVEKKAIMNFFLIKLEKLELQWIDKIVPDFTFIDINGKKWDQNSIKGKPVIFHFWFISCGPCREEFSFLNEMMKKYPDVLWFAISFDDSIIVKKFVKNHKINLITVSNQKEWIKQFKIETYPRTFIINKESKIKDVLYGLYQDSTLLHKRLNLINSFKN